jgi:hypothetical protein
MPKMNGIEAARQDFHCPSPCSTGDAHRVLGRGLPCECIAGRRARLRAEEFG